MTQIIRTVGELEAHETANDKPTQILEGDND